MAVIGISCDNDSLSYVVLDGTINSLKILDCETYPLKQIEKGKLLDAAHHRIETLIKEHKISQAAVLVVDTTFGTGQNTATHPIKHQIEGVILHKLFKDNILCMEYNRKKLNSLLQKKLNKPIDNIKTFIKNNYLCECSKGKIKNDDQRESFAIALTVL